MMKVLFRNKEWELPHGMTVRAAMLKVGLKPEAVLPLRAGKLINDDTIIQDGETITLISVVSGG
jgi:sulfur carrier protein ThiS